MRPKKANFRLSDGVHKPDRNFAFSGRIRPRLRHFRLVKATSLVQTVGSASQEIPQFGTPGSTVYGTNCGFGFSTTTPGYVSLCSCGFPTAHVAASRAQGPGTPMGATARQGRPPGRGIPSAPGSPQPASDDADSPIVITIEFAAAKTKIANSTRWTTLPPGPTLSSTRVVQG